MNARQNLCDREHTRRGRQGQLEARAREVLEEMAYALRLAERVRKAMLNGEGLTASDPSILEIPPSAAGQENARSRAPLDSDLLS